MSREGPPAGASGQTLLSVAAAMIFVACLVILSLVPTPYVVRGPGGAQDTLGGTEAGEEVIRVTGLPVHPTTGRLDLTTVASTRVDARVSLIQALIAHLRPGHATLDRDIAFGDQTSQEQADQVNARLMSDSQTEAVAAAMRAARQPVIAHPVVSSVIIAGPADAGIEPADLIVAVAGQPTSTVDDLTRATAGIAAGDRVILELRRATRPARVEVIAGPGADGPERLGITVRQGWQVPVTVSYTIDPSIGGPSAGLVFALAVYDKVTPQDLLGGRHVAGTGTIDDQGRVGAIGGITQKISAAESAGATVFLVPAANCADVVGLRTSLRLVRVTDLGQAVAVLQAIERGEPDRARNC